MFRTIQPPRRYVVASLSLLACLTLVVATRAQSSAGKWWTGYGNGPDNSRYFASRQINKSNVNQLQVAWTYPHGDTSGNPLVVRGVIYGRGRNGSIVAVDAKTGRELWVRENMNGMSSRGMMYWESRDGRDQRLVFPMNSLLQELDAKTGKSITSFGINGAVDLRVGIDGRDPETIGNIQSQTPGEVFENLIIIGSAPGEGYMSPPGDIRAYDALTGKLVWTFHTVPRPGEFGYDTWPKDAWKYVGGVNNWGEMTVDARRGIAYVPLGSPTYDYYGADRIGANLFGSSIVALDARTGKRLWHFQMVHHDLWDFDNNAAPQLTMIRHNGRNRDVVAVASKTGWLYVFDRVTGEPIWPIEERPVPQTDMPGEQTWPTQPYPTNPPPFAKQSFGVDDINPYLEPAEYERFKQRVLAANNKGLFTPINHTDTVHIPGSNGAALFGGTAAEPSTGAVYVITQDNPGMLRLLKPSETAAGGGGFGPPGLRIYQQHCQQCHGADRLGTGDGVPLAYASADPANNIAAGASRFSAVEIRDILETGRGRMPAFPHLTAADADILIRYLTAVPGPGRGGGPGGRGAGPVPSGAPPELIAGSGSVWTRPEAPGGRGRANLPPYPEGVPQYDRLVINEYGTIGARMKPPFTTIVKYDLNVPAIKWRIGFGDDPSLAERGIFGTGVPQMRNSIIVTESGLVFGAGRDNQVRAWDSDTGKQLWSSRFGGNFVGSPAMYEMDGRQYLLVPAANTPAAPGPMGWVAYALPANYPSHHITNGEIAATIYLPAANNGFYRTTRFDWSGAIASLTYKGHEYYGTWFSKISDIYDFGYEGPKKDVISADFTAMVGPAEEFGALGYNDVPAGGLFVKPGVGVLKRDEMNYNHSRPYAIANGGKWDVKRSRAGAEFTHTLSEPSIGIGYRYTKVVRLTPGKPQMTIAHVMKNTGSKPIVTSVYNHNFTTIDRQTTGPDIEITVPWQMTRAAGRGGRGASTPLGASPSAPARQGPPPADPYAPLAAGERMGTQCGHPQMQSLAGAQGNRLLYTKVLEGSECYQASFIGFGAEAKDNDIRIENKRTGAGVRITGDRPVTRFGYWSIRTVVAPEPYIDLNIEPGQQFAWTYTYDYYTTK